SPRKRISPASGFSVPAIWWIRVDLPAPLGPISAWISPGRRSSETCSVAFSAPKDLERSRMSRTASAMALPPGEQPDQPAAREQHDAEQHEPEEQLPAFGQAAKDEFEHHEQHRAGHRASEPADAAENDQ